MQLTLELDTAHHRFSVHSSTLVLAVCHSAIDNLSTFALILHGAELYACNPPGQPLATCSVSVGAYAASVRQKGQG